MTVAGFTVKDQIMKWKEVLRIFWLRVSHPERVTRLYKAGTMVQIGWHEWTAEEIEEQERVLRMLRNG